MFTGIVQALGTLAASEARGADRALRIDGGALDLRATRVGDSVAVNGVCLTVTGIDGGAFTADVSAATAGATTLGTLAPGARVNLEPALTLAAPLGGHLVSGHVDGTAELVAAETVGDSLCLRVALPPALARYVARKGSVCVDGVSLTVNAVADGAFEANLVPHTQAHTTLGAARAGQRVNLEVDLLARYLETLLARDR